MKKVAQLITLILLNQNIIAQIPDKTNSYNPPKNLLEATSFLNKDSLVFYYNKNYEIVKPECAEIYRFSKVDTATAKLTGRFIDFNYDSSIIAEGFYNNGIKEGLYKLFYLKGQLKESGLYKNGKRTGVWEYWYENGKAKQRINFDYEAPKILDFWDENGVKRVKNGNGYYKINLNYTLDEPAILEGKIANGFQEGKWKLSVSVSESVSYIETYKEGYLIKGIHKFLLGEEEYADETFCNIFEKEYIDNSEKFIVGECYYSNENGLGKIIPPEFKGGDNGFRSFVANNLQYPEQAAQLGVQGRVYLQFIIEPDGRITNIHAIKTDSPLLVNEAIRILKSSPNWKPGTKNGKPIRASYTFPITFILQE